MHSVLLTTNTAADARMIAEFLSKMKNVKSITIDPPLSDEKWSSPMLSLTDEQIENQLIESENGPFLSATDAEEYSKGLIKKWSGKK